MFPDSINVGIAFEMVSVVAMQGSVVAKTIVTNSDSDKHGKPDVIGDPESDG